MNARPLIVLDNFSQPEITLLRYCARAEITAGCLSTIQELVQQDINWSHLLWMAMYNKVQPLLYRSLKMANLNFVPEWVLQRLSNAFEATTVNNLHLTGALINLIKMLQANGISAIPYKGPLLAQSVYGNIGLREFGDLDIIVPEESVLLAKAIVKDAGYTQIWPKVELNEQQERMHICQKYNYEFLRDEDGLDLELHWDVSPNYINCPPRRSDLWQRLDIVMFGGRKIQSFPVEESLIVLAVHGSNHCWNRLSWICDIAELIRVNPDIDWSYLLSLAVCWRSERMLLMALFLAEAVLGAELPDYVSKRIQKDRVAVALAKKSYKWMFPPEFLPFRPFEEPLYHLRMREVWRDKFRYLSKMVSPSAADWSTMSLPRSLRIFYYIIRPFRIGYMHGVRLIKKA